MKDCTGDLCDINVYDRLPFAYYNASPSIYYGSNASDAADLVEDIKNSCGTYSECLDENNRFSVIYAFCGTTMILLAANSALMILGAWSFHARGLAGCCGSLCCCLNFAAIITTGVFRFNNWGQLSALCENCPSKYQDSPVLSDDRTVAGDAALITGLWVCQMIFLCTNCCHMGHAAKPTEVN